MKTQKCVPNFLYCSPLAGIVLAICRVGGESVLYTAPTFYAYIIKYVGQLLKRVHFKLRNLVFRLFRLLRTRLHENSNWPKPRASLRCQFWEISLFPNSTSFSRKIVQKPRKGCFKRFTIWNCIENVNQIVRVQFEKFFTVFFRVRVPLLCFTGKGPYPATQYHNCALRASTKSVIYCFRFSWKLGISDQLKLRWRQLKLKTIYLPGFSLAIF